MGQQIVVDTDYLLDTTKSIRDTSSEITESILTLQNLSTELTAFVNDESMNKFKISFSNFTSNLFNVTKILDSISGNISNLAKDYDEMDNTEASELKHFVSEDEAQQ